MRSWKKIFAFELALALLLTLLPITALAEELSLILNRSATYAAPNEDGYCFTPETDGLYTFAVKETTLASSGDLQVFCGAEQLTGTAARDARWTLCSYTVPLRAGKSYTVFHAASANGVSYELNVTKQDATELRQNAATLCYATVGTPLYFRFAPTAAGEYTFKATVSGKIRVFDADMRFLHEADCAEGICVTLTAGQICYAAIEPSTSGSGEVSVAFRAPAQTEPTTVPTESTAQPTEPPETNAPTQINFSDVAADAWYADAVEYAVANGLMNGMGGGRFELDTAMSRAMLVTVLWRFAGSPSAKGETFRDVPSGTWYTDAVAWASSEGIVGGVGGGLFDPDSALTREQLATILFRYANSIGLNTRNGAALTAFADRTAVSGYAKEALSWAVAEKIISGMPEGAKLCLAPQGSATRAQVATILMRFIENTL